jgi:hypothetical protein
MTDINPLDWIGSIWKIPFVLGVFIVCEHFLIVTCGGGIPFVIAEIAFAVLYAHHYAKTHAMEG